MIDLSSITSGLAPGDTVRLAPGIYSPLRIPAGTARDITIAAADPWDRPVIQYADLNAPGMRLVNIDFDPPASRKGATGNGCVVQVNAEEVTLAGCGFDLLKGHTITNAQAFRDNACNGVETNGNAHYLTLDRCLFRGVNHGILPAFSAWGIDVLSCWFDQHIDDAVRMHGQFMRLWNSLTTNPKQLGKNHVGGATTFGEGRTTAERQANYQEGQQWLLNTFLGMLDPNDPIGTGQQGMGGQTLSAFNLIRAVGNLCVSGTNWGGTWKGAEYSEIAGNVALLDVFALAPAPDPPYSVATEIGFRVTGNGAGVVYTGNQAGKHVYDSRTASQIAADGNITLSPDDWSAAGRNIMPGLDKRDFTCNMPGVGSALVEWCLNAGKNVWDAPAAHPGPLVIPNGQITRPAPYDRNPPMPPRGNDDPKLPDDNLPMPDQPVVVNETPVDEPQTDLPSTGDTQTEPTQNPPDTHTEPTNDYSADFAAIRSAVDAMERDRAILRRVRAFLDSIDGEAGLSSAEVDRLCGIAWGRVDALEARLKG